MSDVAELTGELFPSAPSTETVTQRESHEAVLAVSFDLHPGDVPLCADEWAFRLRLAGLDVRAVTVASSRKVTRQRRWLDPR